jgi:predicted ribosome quality control (RQC) complex YloA/Tae2 family protein
MQKMSGIDLGFAVAEMQPLAGKRIARVRRTPGGIFLFKIWGGELLFQPGVRLHLTRQQMQATDAPDGFVAFLRKNLEGKTAATIERLPGERIAVITTKSKERLVFELFRKGNLVLVSEDGVAMACLYKDEAGGRKVARGEKYEYPKAVPYAAKVPPAVAFSVKENEKGEPVGYSCDAASAGRRFASFSDALDYYYANQKEESSAQKAAAQREEKLGQRLRSQEEALARIEVGRKEANAAADAIIADSDRLDGLLSLVREMKKEGAGEEEMNRALAPRGAKARGQKLEVE